MNGYATSRGASMTDPMTAAHSSGESPVARVTWMRGRSMPVAASKPISANRSGMCKCMAITSKAGNRKLHQGARQIGGVQTSRPAKRDQREVARVAPARPSAPAPLQPHAA